MPAVLLLFLGVFVIIVAWLPMVVRRIPLSLAIVCVGLGCLLVPFLPVVSALPRLGSSISDHADPLRVLAEATMVLAIMGAGLKIDRPFSLSGWQTCWRLLGIAMPLTIAAVMLLAVYLDGFKVADALLLGAALAPTDPVLASDVSVGPPQRGEEGEIRFALTSEAALNDGLAAPVVQLAVALTATSFANSWGDWILADVFYRICGGLACGALIGWLFSLAIFKLPFLPFSDAGDGLIAVGVTLVTYALCGFIHVNGFIAVFVMALMLRWSCPGHEFHLAMAAFAGQVERLAAMLFLFLFGGALTRGLLHPLGWKEIVTGVLLLLVLRPLFGWLSLIGSPHPALSRGLTAFFGIRGIGTLYYLIYACGHARFAEPPRLWALVGLVVVGSILLHGTTATPAMNFVDRKRRAAELNAQPSEREPA